MKHGIYILTFFMTLLGLSESGYAMIPFFTATGDTVRRAVIYFEVSETCVNSCYGSNNQVIARAGILPFPSAFSNVILYFELHTFNAFNLSKYSYSSSPSHIIQI